MSLKIVQYILPILVIKVKFFALQKNPEDYSGLLVWLYNKCWGTTFVMEPSFLEKCKKRRHIRLNPLE